MSEDRIGNDIVRVFAVNINDLPHNFPVSQLLQHIADEKRERLGRMHYRADVLRSLFADLLVRKVLRESLAIEERAIAFSSDEFGKPYLVNVPGIHFNIAHSGEWITVAVSTTLVGIDIEQVIDVDLRIAATFFHPAECSDITTSADPYARFFDYWTLKESYIKYTGKGLSEPLHAFAVRMAANGTARIEVHDQLIAGIYLRQYIPATGYKMALCTSHEHLPASIEFVTTDDIARFFNAV